MFTGLIYEYYVEHHPRSLASPYNMFTGLDDEYYVEHHPRSLASPYTMFTGLDYEYYVEHHPRSLASPCCLVCFNFLYYIIFFACLHFEYYTQFAWSHLWIVYSWLTVWIYPTFKNIYRCIPSEIIWQGRHIYTLTFIRERRMWCPNPITHFNIKCTSCMVIDTQMVYLKSMYY